MHPLWLSTAVTLRVPANSRQGPQFTPLNARRHTGLIYLHEPSGWETARIAASALPGMDLCA